MGLLANRVAVVTGASRGAGRGIALALGEAGATVYVTGRSTAGNATTDGLAGTVDGTAAAVCERGGKGIAVPCDHTDDAQVRALFARVTAEQGRLDLLVNNVWGGYEHYFGTTFADGTSFLAPFWEQSVERWNGMFGAGVRAHLVASSLVAPLMVARGSGLIVHTTAWDRDRYLGNLYYDLAKSAVNRLAWVEARELRPHGVTALALAPGFMRTERSLAAGIPDPSASESPEYIGRAIVALAGDPEVMRHSGKVLTVGDLAEEYGFTDVDGRRIPPFRLPDGF